MNAPSVDFLLETIVKDSIGVPSHQRGARACCGKDFPLDSNYNVHNCSYYCIIVLFLNINLTVLTGRDE